MISHFDDIITDLGLTYLKLDSSLCRVTGLSNVQRHRIGNCAYDIISFAPIFKDVHLQTVSIIQKEEYLLSTMGFRFLMEEMQREFPTNNFQESL